MLVLSRKINERIQIGDDITVVVAHVKGNVVRIGIEAPRNVRVMRSEIQFEQAEQSAQEHKAKASKKRYFSCIG